MQKDRKMGGYGATQYSVVERSHEGFILQVPAIEQYQGVIFLSFGLVWTIGTGAMLRSILQDGLNVFTVVSTMFVGFFVLLGVLMLVASLAEIWKNSKVHPPELILPTYPLLLGETIAVHYRRRLRNGSFRTSAKIEAELICDEWMQYKQGTDTVTKTHTIWKQTLPEQTAVSGESQADYMTEIYIQPSGPPSFCATHNKIRHRLIIKLHAPHTPSAYTSEFLLRVTPEKST